jgi:plasmanylethanolamine desaturase
MERGWLQCMNALIEIPLQALATILLADFAAGFVHWFEDAYIREDTPVIGRVIGRPNTIHHHLPRYMTKFNWWHSSRELVIVSALLVLLAWFFGCLTWHVWLFAIIGANGNQIHKWAHQTRRENGRLISWLQDKHILQSPKHHAVHHTNPKEVRYCPITNWLNPVLDGLLFWEGLEWLLKHSIGLTRRPDTSVPGHGLAPEWLTDLRVNSTTGR